MSAHTPNYDPTKNALAAYVQLYDLFYTNPERRTFIYKKVVKSWKDMPPFLHIELLSSMAESALKNNDQENGLILVIDAQTIAEKSSWPLDYRIPISADLIRLRIKVGDKDGARKTAENLLSLFEEKGEDEIVNIYRADALRPLAEAFQALGDIETARKVYKKAFEQGSVNPNSRPRAEDLSATCCSMALNNVDPT